MYVLATMDSTAPDRARMENSNRVHSDHFISAWRGGCRGRRACPRGPR
uniref:Uncharacterized protein n=1 Tax=Arundo donax TaxID=35708 RepID=A0A0A9HG69_ARUDO